MPPESDLAESFRRTEQRLRRLLLGDGMIEPGVVKGEEARAQVTAGLRQLRDTFMRSLAANGPAEPTAARAPVLPDDLRDRAAHAGDRKNVHIGAEILLTPAEAAGELGVSASSVYRAIKSGRIDAVRLRDGTLRIPASELDRSRATR